MTLFFNTSHPKAGDKETGQLSSGLPIVVKFSEASPVNFSSL